MPYYRRIPKRGFNNPTRVEYSVVNLNDIVQLADNEITVEKLLDRRLVKRNRPVKILGKGEINKPITVQAHAFSATAKQKIEQAGGKVVIIVPPSQTTEQ